jgi:hydroxypyruvate isomerase
MDFSANLSMLYTEHEFLDRFDAAAADGFRGVEFVSPYEVEAEAIAERLSANGLKQALFNAPAGNWAAGERGMASIPGREAEFAEGLERAIAYAQVLNCRQVHVMAGIVPQGVLPEAAEALLVANLRLAAERLGREGIRALCEPINPMDMPGYGLTSLVQAERVMAAVGHDNLWLQFDVYHMAMTGADIVADYQRLLPRIAHIQVADMPGRHEPGSGTIDYGSVFAAIEASKYDGWVGAEYRPAGSTSAGLGWMEVVED